MYRKLMGFYLNFASLGHRDRSRRCNVIPITLRPHGSKFEDVVSALGGLGLLDRGMDLSINGEIKFVCAYTLAFTGHNKSIMPFLNVSLVMHRSVSKIASKGNRLWVGMISLMQFSSCTQVEERWLEGLDDPVKDALKALFLDVGRQKMTVWFLS